MQLAILRQLAEILERLDSWKAEQDDSKRRMLHAEIAHMFSRKAPFTMLIRSVFRSLRGEFYGPGIDEP
jgi:hypothetical protein